MTIFKRGFVSTMRSYEENITAIWKNGMKALCRRVERCAEIGFTVFTIRFR